jgi:hypothetical protein
MRRRALGLVKCWPKGKRRRGSKMEGVSKRNQAKGGETVKPHPRRWCLPYGS